MNRKLLLLLVMLIAVLGVASVASAQETVQIWGWNYDYEGASVDVRRNFRAGDHYGF